MIASLRARYVTSTCALLVCLSAVASLPSCGGGSYASADPSDDAGDAPDTGVPIASGDAAATVHASIASFGATPAVLAKGSPGALLAEFTGVSATIDQGAGAVTSKTPLAVTPAASTVYTLTVTGNDGSTATATTTIDVYDHVTEVSFHDPSGPGSLTEAVAAANAAPGTTAITFALADPSTITPSETLVTSGAITIIGPGAAKLTISGGDHHRLFFVSGGALTMSGLTLAHGLGAGGNGGTGIGGGGGGAGMGGAMFINAGTVTLKDLVVSENVAQGGAGGTVVYGTANGGGGGGFGGDGDNGGIDEDQGGKGGSGGELGGIGAAEGMDATGDGAGGGGAGAGAMQNGGSGTFGAGGGGYGGLSGGGSGGFGAGAGAGDNSTPGMFGGAGNSNFSGGGAGLGGAVFLRAGTLLVTNGRFTNNHALGGASGGPLPGSGKAKAGAIFSLVPTITLTGATYSGNAAADAVGSLTDSADVYLTP